MIHVLRAKHGGFCMGVALALNKLDALVTSHSGPIATMGEIIHNPQVIESYARKGVRCLQSTEEAREDMAVLIRAHGIPRESEADLRRRSAHVEDATCPRVKKAQLAIAKTTAPGHELLLYGEAAHPEVRGLISYAAGASHIFSSLEEMETLLSACPFQGRSVVLAAQTTQDRILFEKMRQRLSEILGDSLTVLDTICDATRERQNETVALAERVQAMVVVGGRASGNTRRLAELAKARGVPTVLVETAEELNSAQFQGYDTVGLTAGASTPKSIIDEVENRLQRW